MKKLWMLFFATVPAFASTIYPLTIDHCSGGCGASLTTPAGQVQVDQLDPTDFEVTVTLFDNNMFVSTGLPAFVFDLSGAPTLGGETTISSGFAFDGVTAGSIHDDGFGYFEYGFTCTACGTGGSNPQVGPLQFTINVPVGTQFVSNGTAFFAADIISGQTGQTGPVGSEGPLPGTPEPQTSVEAGLGLTMVLLSLGYRKLRRQRLT